MNSIVSNIEVPEMKVFSAGDPETLTRRRKIQNDTIARLLLKVRRMVESWIWEDGMIWYPQQALRRIPPGSLAARVLPEEGTPAHRACVQEIRDYTNRSLSSAEALSWLAGKIEERLDRYVLQARSKLNKVQMVVTEKEIELRAERPDTTFPTVGPAPFQYD